eukprot:m.1113028 g.1113028  ORF g.1113028 m.1113028 type:complete len:365 (+) comp24363_c0_seq1:309-1403(+)
MATSADHKVKQKKLKSVSRSLKVFNAPNPVVAVAIWGLNHSMTSLEAVPAQPLVMKDDFKSFSKISIQNQGFSSAMLPSKFKIKEYCPLVFRDLRDRFGLDPRSFLDSWVSGPASEVPSSGRLNAVAYASADKKMLMQELKREEVAMFHNLFQQYHTYIVEHHGSTLLPHFLGLYRVSVGDTTTFLIVTRNVHGSAQGMQRVYDLKGSQYNREASDREKEKDVPTLKDMDFIERREKLRLGADAKIAFLEILKRDVEFLAKLKLMDYSLFVGIEELAGGAAADADDTDDPACDVEAQDVYAFPGSASGETFHIGIVDVLTRYGTRKSIAHNAKVLKHGSKAEISTVNPEQYMIRFLKFFTDNTE